MAPRRRLMSLVALLLVVGLGVGSGGALFAGDEVTLVDGRVIAGELLSGAGDDTVRIRVQQGTMRAVHTFPRRQVVSVARGVNDHLAALADLRAELASYASVPFAHREGWWTSLSQVAAMGETIDHLAGVRQFLTVFPDHVPAREVLGHRLYQGEWMSEAEIMLAKGYTRYQGAWRSETEIEALEEQEALRREARQQRREMRRVQREMLAAAARIERWSQSHGARSGYAYFSSTHPLDLPNAHLIYPGIQRWTTSWPIYRQPFYRLPQHQQTHSSNIDLHWDF